MTRKKSVKDAPEEKKSFWTTLPGILTAIAGLITAITGLVVAINSTVSLFPQATATATASPVDTSTPVVVTPATYTPFPPPVFTTRFVLYSEASPNPDIEQVEFDYEPGTLPEESIQEFILLDEVAFGILEPDAGGFSIRLVLRNTGEEPVILDLTERFFSLVDDRGQSAELVYFCCASRRGEILGEGQERIVQLYFRAPEGWFGKDLSADYILIRVDGLLPVTRLAWRMPTLAVAN